MKIKFLLLTAVIIAVTLAVYVFINSSFSVYDNVDKNYTQIKINDKVIWAEIVDTPELREKGLSGRKNLDTDEGLLFIFEEKEIYPFWMKDMNFPLDMIWIEDDKIIDISKNVPMPEADKSLPLFQPQSAVNKVLEVNAGYCDANNVKIGDIIEIKNAE